MASLLQIGGQMPRSQRQGWVSQPTFRRQILTTRWGERESNMTAFCSFSTFRHNIGLFCRRLLVNLRVVVALLVPLIGMVVSATAQTPAQVGDIFVGTCDSSQTNTQLDQTDVYTPHGQFVALFRGPQQNSCTTGMTFD